MKKIIVCLFLLIVSIILYGKYIEPNMLRVKEYKIETDKVSDSYKKLKIVHFSDILYDNNNKRLNKIKKKINDLDADILVFTGDFFNKKFNYNDNDYKDIEEFLKGLKANLYKYAVLGDNDLKFSDEYKDILYESGFTLLDNQNTLLFYKDVTPINIIGITNSEIDANIFNPEVESSLNIVITHQPDNIKYLKDYNKDIVLAGHSLGGIINIPFYGGLLKTEGAKKYLNNYYKVDDTLLYINNGIGYEKLNYRLFNAPTINVYRFE